MLLEKVDVTCFSFAPSKHLGSFESGGMAVTSSEALYRRIQRITGYGQDRTQHYNHGLISLQMHHKDVGVNERIDELQVRTLAGLR